MEEFKHTIKSLHALQEVRASETLRKRIQGLTYALPVERKQFMPGFAFAALVMVVLLIFICAGSQFLMASQTSKPGNFLYPMKETLKNVQVPVSTTIEKKIITPTPTISQPTPSVTPTGTSHNSIQQSFRDMEDTIKYFFKRDGNNLQQTKHQNNNQKNNEGNSFNTGHTINSHED